MLSTIGLIVISTIAISLYATSNPPMPAVSVTASRVPDSFKSPEGWNEYGSGFPICGIGGALLAYALLALDLTKFISNYLFQ
nr:photosystem I reaction center subunit XI [Planktothrix sp. FACHB-1355]